MSFSSFKKLVCQKSCFSSKKSENIEYNEYFQRLCLLYKLSYYLFLMKIKLKFSSSNLNLTLMHKKCMHVYMFKFLFFSVEVGKLTTYKLQYIRGPI